MHVLSGLERADSGKVFFNDSDLSLMTEMELTKFRKENIGFIFQQYCLLPHLNVENNVKMGAFLAHNKNFSEILNALGLLGKRKSMPSELSGGEQQRVCIARALAKKPSVLFLDEPTGALDEKTGRDVLNTIMREKEKSNFTMIMVTHNSGIAEMAETVIRINSGEIVGISKNSTQKSAYEIRW